jgi:hypothetical protein
MAIVLGGLVGAAVGLFSLDAQTWIYGPRHASTRYSGVGGGILGLIEGAYAMCVGGLLGARLAWLACGAISFAVRKQRIPGSHLVRADVVVLAMALLWIYLIYASW